MHAKLLLVSVLSAGSLDRTTEHQRDEVTHVARQEGDGVSPEDERRNVVSFSHGVNRREKRAEGAEKQGDECGCERSFVGTVSPRFVIFNPEDAHDEGLTQVRGDFKTSGKSVQNQTYPRDPKNLNISLNQFSDPSIFL